MTPEGKLTLTTDASDNAVGAVLHQIIDEKVQPLGFYSRKLTTAQRNYSAYDRELTAVYQAIQHFKYVLEGREFAIFTDHKPLIFAFKQKNEKASPRRARQLDFISQYSTDIRHLPGVDNNIADMLSRINILTHAEINFDEMATLQANDDELKLLLRGGENISVTLEKLAIPNSTNELFCHVANGKVRPYVPQAARKLVIEKIHGLSHPGIRATRHLVSERFFWPGMAKEIGNIVRTCIPCQKAKKHRHTKSPVGDYKSVDERFAHINIDLVGPLPSSNGYLLFNVYR